MRESFPRQVDKESAAAAKSFQSCPTLCDPRDGSPPGFQSLGFSRREHWSGVPSDKESRGSWWALAKHTKAVRPLSQRPKAPGRRPSPNYRGTSGLPVSLIFRNLF